jgi:hypothetical protein
MISDLPRLRCLMVVSHMVLSLACLQSTHHIVRSAADVPTLDLYRWSSLQRASLGYVVLPMFGAIYQ